MSNALALIEEGTPPILAGEERKFVTLRLGEQLFGIDVFDISDVLRQQKIARIPLAPPIIAGALNLRGRIVTAIDLRVRLGMAPFDDLNACLSAVVEYKDHLYSLLVDSVGEVLSLPVDNITAPPGTLDAAWRDVAEGVYRLEDELLIILNINQLLSQ